MKTLNVAAFALNAALYVAAGVFFYSVLPVSFGPVRFWPQAIIPAIFAVVFGPWVGGLGGAVGIFMNDLILSGNPVLSLLAGVTSNFAAFFIIGYIANKKTHWSIPVVGYGVVTAILTGLALIYTNITFVIVAALSYAFFIVILILFRNSKWRSLELGSVVGMLVGAAIIGIMVPVYSQFFAPQATPFTAPVAIATFLFTFFTEIPFLIVLGPPIVWAIERAFPFIKQSQETKEKAKQ
ncbi:MAG: ECF transporter S component [Candidatus Bathyarchaeia archaeon]